MNKTNIPDLYDNAFFRKESIQKHKLFTYIGRRDPLAEWKVTGVVTLTPDRKRPGYSHQHEVDTVCKLVDQVTLERSDGGLPCKRVVSAGYLIYSSVWRLKPVTSWSVVVDKPARKKVSRTRK